MAFDQKLIQGILTKPLFDDNPEIRRLAGKDKPTVLKNLEAEKTSINEQSEMMVVELDEEFNRLRKVTISKSEEIKKKKQLEIDNELERKIQVMKKNLNHYILDLKKEASTYLLVIDAQAKAAHQRVIQEEEYFGQLSAAIQLGKEYGKKSVSFGKQV